MQIDKSNILLVDDTPDNLRLLSTILTEQDYEVRKALDGQMALTACQKLVPDLILLDVMMPEMDGYEVCQHLKADQKTCNIPVIFISALNDVFDKVKAFEAGGVDYISKPFHKAEVLARVETHLNLSFLRQKLQQKNILLEQALTDVKQAQSQLIQSEKMAALGQLVAGIAHEVNNPVSFISGNLDYARQYTQDLLTLTQAYQAEYPQPSTKIQTLINELDLQFLINDLHNLMEGMQRGAKRIQELVLSLRTFARLDEAEMKSVDISAGIESTLLILQHRFRETEFRPQIEVIKNYEKSSIVNCYASQINQVFMHLLNNAIDAIDAKSASQPQIHIHTELTDLGTIKIRVADNGCGIPESARSQIFDPFFTTKPVGSGKGLGLAISYQIVVQKHHGKLTYYSTLGEGTEFIVEIPVNLPITDIS